ncbi:MAG: hypothetical protein M3460_28305 [Actinomycetota bacterium]|nr:hypothetical protein [Actinomycetota bacterium]
MATSSPALTTSKVGLAAPVANKLHATKEAVQAKVEGVKQHLHKGGEAVQGKAEEATLQARSAANVALAKLPSPVSGRVEQLAKAVRQRPAPAAAVMLSLLALVVLRFFLARNR